MELLRRSAHESGATVIVVSHDPRMIRFADRVVELEDGAIRRCYRLLRESHNNLLPTVPANTTN
jgi:putative ABC transport system ATP-binding protein